MRYRKKPVEIDAVPVRDLVQAAGDDWAALPRWVTDAYDAGHLTVDPDGVHIQTLEGRMRGDLADMLVRGTRGELYPCKPEPFADSYEPAAEAGA